MMTVLFLHTVICLFMTGLIWTIQRVHYPLFSYVDHSRFSEFELQHTRRISWIVMPAMLLELVTAVALQIQFFSDPVVIVNSILLALIWLVTFIRMMPLHNQLTTGFDSTALRALVFWNWPRTIAWSSRSVILLLFLWF